MEDNNQTNDPSEVPTTAVRQIDEEITRIFNFVRRETNIHNHLYPSVRQPVNILPVSSLAPNIPSNQFYFHDLFRNRLSYQNATRTALENSIREQGGVKNVISDDGKKQLISESYKKEKFINSVCPITQEEFSEGDTVVVLPCNHCFYHDGIMRWLETDKAECPVCRYKLSSKEVSNHDHHADDDLDEEHYDEVDDDEDEEDEEEHEEDDDGYSIDSLFTPQAHPNLDIVGNAIPRVTINPLLTQIIENMVRQNTRNNIDTAANILQPQEENVENNIDTSEEDNIDLQMAIFASMMNNDVSSDNDSDDDNDNDD